MNWTETAKLLFDEKKPEHFTNYRHCAECYEHDQILREFDRDSIGVEQLGRPAWDPMSFCSASGMKYYMPAMIRLCIDTIDDEFYLEQFLFHLDVYGEENRLYRQCSMAQRRFIASFLEYLIDTYSSCIEEMSCSGQVLRVHELWSGHDT